VRIEPYKSSLKLLGDGVILGLNGERKLGFVSRALDAVELEVGRLLPNQLHQLLAMNGGDFSIPNEYENWQEDRVVERFAEVRPTLSNTPGKPVYDNLDLSSYFQSDSPSRSKLGIFLVRSKGLVLNDPAKQDF